MPSRWWCSGRCPGRGSSSAPARRSHEASAWWRETDTIALHRERHVLQALAAVTTTILRDRADRTTATSTRCAHACALLRRRRRPRSSRQPGRSPPPRRRGATRPRRRTRSRGSARLASRARRAARRTPPSSTRSTGRGRRHAPSARPARLPSRRDAGAADQAHAAAAGPRRHADGRPSSGSRPTWPRCPSTSPTIRSWRLSRVAGAAAEAGRWTHAWEQEYASLDGLTGEYMMNPFHWTTVDAWFDAEVPDHIVEPELAHLFTERDTPWSRDGAGC